MKYIQTYFYNKLKTKNRKNNNKKGKNIHNSNKK